MQNAGAVLAHIALSNTMLFMGNYKPYIVPIFAHRYFLAYYTKNSAIRIFHPYFEVLASDLNGRQRILIV